jgi:Peptidase U49
VAVGAESLALEHLRHLGVPATFGGYTKEDAVRVLQGRGVESTVRDIIHNKLAWIVGVQLIGHINQRFPQLRWTHDRVVVRTLLDGEASASVLSFPDGSHAILVSRALQENLICMANVVEYLDISTALARLSFRRKKRERERFESAARVATILRYLLLGYRMRGAAPPAPAQLDKRSFDIAGKMAAGALMFVVAHEIAHIAHRHETVALTPHGPDGPVTVSERQELQADVWAVNFLKKVMADDPAPENDVLWSAFIALFAMHVTEQALYIRRNRTHPEAWARWAVLEKLAATADDRTEGLRLTFLNAVASASNLTESFPNELWPLLWQDRMLSVAPLISEETLMWWDHLHTADIDELAAKAERSATPDGKLVLRLLRSGDLEGVLGRIVPSPRRRDALLNPSAALAFSTLRQAFDDTPTRLSDGNQTAFSVVATRIAAQHLGMGDVRV